MKPLCIVVTVLLSFAASTPAYADLHTGYWTERTETGSEFRCELVDNIQQMLAVLSAAGWNTSVQIPDIDWHRDQAIIIAPSTYYKNGHIAFYGLKPEDNTIFLDYGWDPSTSITSPGAGTITIGSSLPGSAETIVVSFKRELKSNYRFMCRENGMNQ